MYMELSPEKTIYWVTKQDSTVTKRQIIPCIFSDHNALKLELNHKEKFGRNSNTWKLRTILLKNDRVNQVIKKEIKQFLETNENENTSVQTYRTLQRQS